MRGRENHHRDQHVPISDEQMEDLLLKSSIRKLVLPQKMGGRIVQNLQISRFVQIVLHCFSLSCIPLVWSGLVKPLTDTRGDDMPSANAYGRNLNS